MPSVTVMLKPASGLCNLNCKYCFYKDEAENREKFSYGLMTPDVQEAVIKRVLAYAEESCTVVFQGGEPTLAGLDFYRRIVELEKKWNINNVTVHNSIQTNGCLIDDSWAKFFAENHFLVGISLDGPKEIHNLNRIDNAGSGTYSRVMHSIRLLNKYKVEINVLTVITAAVGKKIRKIYGFYDRNGLKYQQYIPCFDPIGEERGNHSFSLTADIYEQCLKTLFDLWYEDFISGKRISIRYFDNLLLMMRGYWPEACGMSGICGRQYVIEADGSVYPCDFYVLDQWKLGNFVTNSFENIEKKRSELQFIKASEAMNSDCLSCKWKNLCCGGCRRDREQLRGRTLGKNYYCSAYYHFFEYVYPRLYQISRMC
ncbi:MAG TPA: anaerobic sulfatase maturase [Caproicibacter sp.]|nr:anaerobic sulfatase maturase [Caproicibacter sp.]